MFMAFYLYSSTRSHICAKRMNLLVPLLWPVHHLPHSRFLLHAVGLSSLLKPRDSSLRPLNSRCRSFFRKPIPYETRLGFLIGGTIIGFAFGVKYFLKSKLNLFQDSSYNLKYNNEQQSLPRSQEHISENPVCRPSPVPAHVAHLIVGAGAAGLSAARSIRATEPSARVLLVGGDATCGEAAIGETAGHAPPPYIRPLLSKGLWWREISRQRKMLNPDGDIRKHSWLYFEPTSFYLKPEELDESEEGGIAILYNNPVVRLDADAHKATLADGQVVGYDCCLIATGAEPRRLRQLETCSQSGVDLVGLNGITYFRSLADYRRLRAVIDDLRDSGGRVAVIGDSALASELAISMSGRQVPKEKQTESALSVVHLLCGAAPLSHILPPAMAQATAQFEIKSQVRVLPHSDVVGVRLLSQPVKEGGTPKMLLTLRSRAEQGSDSDTLEEIEVDHIVCSIGLEPRTALAASARLELDHSRGGYLVNSEFESRSDIYVAGAAASYWDPVLEHRRRVEHLNFSEETGALAGINMAHAAGKVVFSSKDEYDPRQKAFEYQPSLWCNLGSGLSWDAVGLIDSENLITRSFFFQPPMDDKNKSDSTPLPTSECFSRGVAFYLTPIERKLVGILLWNIPEDLFVDKEYAAPSRLNIARQLLLDRMTITNKEQSEMDQLATIARQFDLPEEIKESYAEMKAIMESKKKELESLENDKLASIPSDPMDSIQHTEQVKTELHQKIDQPFLESRSGLSTPSPTSM